MRLDDGVVRSNREVGRGGIGIPDVRMGLSVKSANAAGCLVRSRSRTPGTTRVLAYTSAPPGTHPYSRPALIKINERQLVLVI
jgi:hypothetical protein